MFVTQKKVKSSSNASELVVASALNRFMRGFFIITLLRPAVWLLFGLNRYDRIKVPSSGAFILAPNHNSHLDVLLIAALLPLKQACRIRTAAAADYFWQNPLSRWFVFGLFSAIPVWRAGKAAQNKGANVVDALDGCLKSSCPVLIFPEGTRGAPDSLAQVKSGVARLAVLNQELPIVPLVFSGLGKSLPKGSKVLLPIQPKVIQPDWIYPRGQGVEALRKTLQEVFEDNLTGKTTRKGQVDD